MPPVVEVRAVPIAATRGLRHAVLRPHESVEAIIEHEIRGAFAAGAFDPTGELISVGFVVQDGGPGTWRVRGMATAPEARGRGAGSAVLQALVSHARERGATRVWCNARIAARSLYERAGFRVVSDQFDIPEIGPHLRMELRLG